MKRLEIFLKQIQSASAKGFTLIELLVVVGILGILAAALIATIDPFEQLNKAQDTTMKNLSTEFVSANVRYYGTHSALPWFSTANGGANCYTGGATLNAVTLSSLTTCLNTIVSDGELKQGYISAQNLNQLTATNPNPQTGNTTDTIVCFQPKSKAQQKDPNTRFTQTGATGTNCKSTGGTASCYWCAQ